MRQGSGIRNSKYSAKDFGKWWQRTKQIVTQKHESKEISRKGRGMEGTTSQTNGAHLARKRGQPTHLSTI